METLTSHDEQALQAQLAQARERLDGLVRNLRGIDAELENLSGERTQYRLLQQVCGGLEELSALGAAGLFWSERAADGSGEQHVRLVRSRVDEFEKRLSEIEDRRQAMLEEIQLQGDDTEVLEDGLFELKLQEERQKLEWVPEREASVLPERPFVMPWMRVGEEDRRFRKSLAVSLALSLLFALLIPLIDLPSLELGTEPVEVPPRLARLIMEQKPLPPAPKPEEKPLEALAQETVPKEQQTQKPKEGPGKGSGEGPGVGPGKGILAFKEKFSGFAENRSLSRLGSQARISSPGAAPSGVVERSMVATQAPGSSGGINLASLSRGIAGGGGGGGSLAGVQIARVTSSLGGGGNGTDRPLSGDGPGLSRTDEEIQIVFDRHKAALYRLYNRELRRDPTLKGQMVLRIRIEPNGSVSLCEQHASDMNAPQLSAQVLERVRTFDFGAKEGIAAITILYPIDFLPAA